MKINTWFPRILGLVALSSFLFFSSCNKKELYEIKGTVLDTDNSPINDATIQIFKNPEDWLTGHNVISSMSSDMIGEFESRKVFEPGDYYIFVEKYDTSNWNIRDIERGIYPKITIPLDGRTIQIAEQNNMRLLANTDWNLSNMLREYTKPNTGTAEWHSIWTSTNNCVKDNSLHFGKDLSLRISEGEYVCSGYDRNTLGSFVPPMIFTTLGCQKLLHTSQKVKPFEFSGWEEMQNKNAKMFIACDQGLGQLYLIYDHSPTSKRLHVYSRN